MRISICLVIVLFFSATLPAQVLTYYSDELKATVSIDMKAVQPSNSRGFLVLADGGEVAVSHQLEGVRAKDDSLKAAAEKLSKNTGAAGGGASLAQVQASLNSNAATKANLENELAIIAAAKKRAYEMVDQERRNYVHVVERARAAAAEGRRSQYQPTTHHDFYSPAYEQLKHINSTGNW